MGEYSTWIKTKDLVGILSRNAVVSHPLSELGNATKGYVIVRRE